MRQVQCLLAGRDGSYTFSQKHLWTGPSARDEFALSVAMKLYLKQIFIERLSCTQRANFQQHPNIHQIDLALL